MNVDVDVDCRLVMCVKLRICEWTSRMVMARGHGNADCGRLRWLGVYVAAKCNRMVCKRDMCM